MKKFALLIIFAFSAFGQISAQSVDLTEEEKETLTRRIEEKLDDFQYFLQTMADKRNSLEVRNNAKSSNMKLFIGNCEPYTGYHEWTNQEIKYPAVRMETSSLNRKQRSKQTMKLYFNKILGGMGYANIRIEKSETVVVSNFRKIGEGKYEALATFYQDFQGFRERGTVGYSDKTQKQCKIHIDLVTIETPDGNEKYWEVKLGDMKVLSTERLK